MPRLEQSPIFLIGFMATGKSTVGKLVAERTGRRAVDLDERVAERAGMEVPEIFRTQGERGFRDREAAALRDACEENDVVVACGGGTPTFEDNLERMRARGTVVALRASMKTVLARALAPGAPERPMLAGDAAAAAERLFAAREKFYAQADVTIETDGRSVEDVADEVVARAGLHLGHVAVKLGERTYPIHWGQRAHAGDLARELWGGKVARIALLTDSNVKAAGHAGAVGAALGSAGFDVHEIAIPAGEVHKTLAQAEQVAAACVHAGLDRKSALVAVGGGVVGDLGGFVASMLYRGIPCAQVPTTLLAMIDSSIGGKTGVDTPAGKNLLGAFWQPRFVLAAPETLTTLPRRELAAAFGELIKYALLDERVAALDDLRLDVSAEELEPLVLRCAAYKADVVGKDERELTGLRAVLNLGHTVGHGIEAAALHTSAPLLHGEAIALGLIAAARISARLGLADAHLEAQVTTACRRLELPHDLAPWLRPEVFAYLGTDKKRVGSEVRFIAVEKPGSVKTVSLAPERIEALLRAT